MAARRGLRSHPANFHTDGLRSSPPGHFVDVMINGFGAMPSYAKQLSARDRWAVVAYIRALQLSQSARVDDVPADERRKLESQKQ
jgi:mono/diheme cytochrome c family protein